MAPPEGKQSPGVPFLATTNKEPPHSSIPALLMAFVWDSNVPLNYPWDHETNNMVAMIAWIHPQVFFCASHAQPISSISVPSKCFARIGAVWNCPRRVGSPSAGSKCFWLGEKRCPSLDELAIPELGPLLPLLCSLARLLPDSQLILLFCE